MKSLASGSPERPVKQTGHVKSKRYIIVSTKQRKVTGCLADCLLAFADVKLKALWLISPIVNARTHNRRAHRRSKN